MVQADYRLEDLDECYAKKIALAFKTVKSKWNIRSFAINCLDDLTVILEGTSVQASSQLLVDDERKPLHVLLHDKDAIIITEESIESLLLEICKDSGVYILFGSVPNDIAYEILKKGTTLEELLVEQDLCQA